MSHHIHFSGEETESSRGHVVCLGLLELENGPAGAWRHVFIWKLPRCAVSNRVLTCSCRPSSPWSHPQRHSLSPRLAWLVIGTAPPSCRPAQRTASYLPSRGCSGPSYPKPAPSLGSNKPLVTPTLGTQVTSSGSDSDRAGLAGGSGASEVCCSCPTGRASLCLLG